MDDRPSERRIDQVFSVLSQRPCRILLAHIDAAAVDVFTLEELADVLNRRGVEQPGIGESRHEPVKLELHHNYLPRMEAAGLIEYDPRSGDVRHRGWDDVGPDVSALLDRKRAPKSE